MAKRQAIEAVDRTFQDIIGVSLPFGGKIMVMGGDLRQVLPVIKRSTRAQIVDASLRMSRLWSLTKKMRLTTNMRALNDPWFSDFLLIFGDGNKDTIEGSFIRVPDDMTIPFTIPESSIKELMNAVFPSIQTNLYSSDYIISRAILSTTNDSFKLKRKQFPIQLSFSMKINKAQEQTIPHVGVYLPNFVFPHGQIYVALSRGISRENTKVLVHPSKEFSRDDVYTSNVVFHEVLHDE
ncbi:hypothetical protein E3N88_23296 [Mikania micrantha]|uniref:ATP-dependent DNA helicase n=1 Tax=Mikania micrantha TaxID=192012 RepID=A0A5N6NFH4_9ASTR|nr:hypothetical protein E3N88_23296 [Mikania micrantha]